MILLSAALLVVFGLLIMMIAGNVMLIQMLRDDPYSVLIWALNVGALAFTTAVLLLVGAAISALYAA